MKMVDRVSNYMAPGSWLHNCREITDVINNFNIVNPSSSLTQGMCMLVMYILSKWLYLVT